MSEFLSEDDLKQLQPADRAFSSPIPTQMVSNGEFMPAAQGEAQKQVERRIIALADELGGRRGQDRRSFLATTAGMAAAFLAMNDVYGPLFDVSRAEAATPELADERAQALAGQYIVDLHTHYLRDDAGTGLRSFGDLRERIRKKGENPQFEDRRQTLADLHLNTYVKEIWLDSDTKIAALSGAPSDIPNDWFLTNSAIAETRAKVNGFAGSRRLLSHFIFTPGQPGWLEAIDEGVERLKPDAWKGYTIGDNTHKEISRYPWRMDDEKVAYKGYEKFAKAGIRNIAVHKGLFTLSDEEAFPGLMDYAKVDDVGKAAKDWPQLNFLIYHAGYRYTGQGEPALAISRFEKTGRMDWVSDLAEIPAKYNVTNVYADVGATFAACCVSEPTTAAVMLGILIKGLGVEHVIWGTDSILFGSPQWQIEALRRLEIPEELQRSYGFAPLGPADGPVKKAILGENGAKLHRLTPSRAGMNDNLDAHRQAYRESGGMRSNRAYGWVRI